MYGSENPIAIQSKKWIVDALLKLMERKPLRKITIQEITEKAQLDRRTFYRNFESKEDVLNYYIKSLSEEYLVALLQEEEISIPMCLQIFFVVAEKHKAFLVQLRDNDLLMFLLNRFINEILPTIHGLVENRSSCSLDLANEENKEYILSYNIGGFWNILVKWINEDLIKTPREIAEIVNKLMI